MLQKPSKNAVGKEGEKYGQVISKIKKPGL